MQLRGDTLHKETNRKGSDPEQAKNNEVAPVQSKNSVLFTYPGDCDKCECVHRMPLFNLSPFVSQAADCSRGRRPRLVDAGKVCCIGHRPRPQLFGSLAAIS